ncbi:DNA modification methylase [Anaerospora hongkongensis]|uniref:Methyltransferase n=1 Tax=Anaerospora hongkongensis TaxID=244830 RepID=A0A4V2Q8B3_9FIRM|nr:DNA methyltransferase [Anaerospora hongkongensis]TCL35627.1 DNA modification methylase [Anaerospora hongkongensis]
MQANTINQIIEPEFAIYNGDCVEIARSLPDNSVHYSIFSPPFASLYTYSNSDRDMGNCSSDGEFFEHFRYLIRELYRVIMPGRLVSFHCMNLPTSKTHHGYIGIRDFRGDLIRAFEAEGWIYHSEVCIWKDPVIAQQRTKALGLLHKQIVKDSAMSRQGIPDYLVTMRKPGINLEAIAGEFEEFVGSGLDVSREAYDQHAAKVRGSGREPWPFEMWRSVSVWQKYASPVWMDINPNNTLQYRSARDEKDEKHICPLQLEVIARGIELWSNPGDIVFSPFAGIGSEGYQAIKMDRQFVGVELKESYYKISVNNLRAAVQESFEALLG